MIDLHHTPSVNRTVRRQTQLQNTATRNELIVRMLTARPVPSHAELKLKALLMDFVETELLDDGLGLICPALHLELTGDTLFKVTDVGAATELIKWSMNQNHCLPVLVVAFVQEKPRRRWRISYPPNYTREFIPGVPFSGHEHPSPLSLCGGSASRRRDKGSKRPINELRATAPTSGGKS